MSKKSKILVTYSIQFEQEVEVELPENLRDDHYECKVGSVFEEEYGYGFDNIFNNNDNVFRNFDPLKGKMIEGAYDLTEFKITEL